MNKATVPLPVRYTFLLFELAGLLVANHIAFGSLLPTSDPSGLWFYAALFGLLLGQRLDTPFFTAPKDAVLYAIPALVAALQISNSAWSENEHWGLSARALLIGWISLVLVASSLAVWLQTGESEPKRKLSAVSAQLSGALGNPRAFFSVILFLMLLAFPPSKVEGLLLIFAAWSLTVPFSLLDYLYALSRRLKRSLTLGKSSTIAAEVAAHQVPNLVVFRTESPDLIRPGCVMLYRDTTSDLRLASVVGHAGRDSGALMRAVDLGLYEPRGGCDYSFLETLQAIEVAADLLNHDQSVRAASLKEECIGFVAPDSDIGKLIVEIVAEKDLAAGRLIQTKCGTENVFYQLTNGLTKEEIVQQKNTFGFVAAQARSVGIWKEGEARFKPVTWVPAPNSPVLLVEPKATEFDLARIGTFPGSNFAVRLRDVNYLVTHNTAILGILGVGKSTLAMELVERVLKEGCKAIVLDLTDQYASEFGALYDSAYNDAVTASLQEIGAAGKANVKQNVEEGGSRKQFAVAVEEKIEGFMNAEQRLLILNPASFEVWKQDSKPFSGNASMASLTSCELTHIVSDASLRVVQRMGRIDKARLLLVYEEAHSLVPEWNATVGEGDRAASNGTARAILQGRKYGLGCFLITQRTASVTKTILNQCNSVFAMRSFDDTGREFLSNYIGREYAALLPSLPERNAIFFGRASSSENPVQVELNDRTVFVAAFRAQPKHGGQAE